MINAKKQALEAEQRRKAYEKAAEAKVQSEKNLLLEKERLIA